MEMMSQYGVNVPRGEVAYTPEQARTIAEKFGKYKWVLYVTQERFHLNVYKSLCTNNLTMLHRW